MLLKEKTLSRDNIRNILLIQLGDIGDVLLTFPAIRALKENFPGPMSTWPSGKRQRS